ncbi:MAG TPA: phosphoribosylamine--glycine ligase [Blastocatellia bacterium]|jgi:phosphoribosylamine--glycine ligase|nr:phosphoribosylamine--glycine ligase [Blastocatellia bacterium]
MKVFVIGSGGREHALVWSLARSPIVKQIYSATANAGILKQTKRADVSAGDVNSIAEFAAREKIDLVVVGPEQPLVDGLADALDGHGVAVFGPSRAAARLEGSKVFAKEFMKRHNIPTARHHVTDKVEDALKAVADLTGGHLGFPVVVKAEGLAAGKGVIIAEDEAQARQAIEDLLISRKLGDAGARLVIEECLAGRELSYLVFSDGKDYMPMPVAQDHKRAFDDDRGPNTGGMGAFSTPGLLDERLERRIAREIVEPTLEAARAEGFPFRGVLYCGLMVTSDGPKALEYNVRFGDPETQAILRRFDGDFAEIALAVAQGRLTASKPRQTPWSNDAATCVVMASDGYPGDYSTGKTITGIDEADLLDGVVVFQAGTKLNADGKIVTAGGRVLGVTARAATLDKATSQAYEALSLIRFDGMQFRRDIGAAR